MYNVPRPTIGRIVHYRLENEWVAAFVVADEKATPETADEIELLLPSRLRGRRTLRVTPEGDKSPARGVAIWCAHEGRIDLELVAKPLFLAHVFVKNVPQGVAFGCWRWPPREGGC
jgi:hypothetical protein